MYPKSEKTMLTLLVQNFYHSIRTYYVIKLFSDNYINTSVTSSIIRIWRVQLYTIFINYTSMNYNWRLDCNLFELFGYHVVIILITISLTKVLITLTIFTTTVDIGNLLKIIIWLSLCSILSASFLLFCLLFNSAKSISHYMSYNLRELTALF